MIKISEGLQELLNKKVLPQPKYQIILNIESKELSSFGSGEFGVNNYGGIKSIDISEYLISPPSINITIEIETKGRRGKANDITLILDNSENKFNPYSPDSLFYNIPFINSIIDVYVFFSEIPNEKIKIFTGYIKTLTIKDEKAIINCIDRFAQLLEKKMPTKNKNGEPASDPNTFLIEYNNKTPGEILWDLLTNKYYGLGLDSVKNIDNKDINYQKWLEFVNNTNDIKLTGGFYNEETIGEAIDEILKVSKGTLYINFNNNKFEILSYYSYPKFRTQLLVLEDNANNNKFNLFSVSFSKNYKNIINNIIVKYDYDKINESFKKIFNIASSESILKYGFNSYLIESKFLRDTNNVFNICDDFLLRYQEPITELEVEVDLSAIIFEISDLIIINNPNICINNQYFELLEKNINFNTGKAKLKLHDASIFQLNDDEYWGFVWDVNTENNGHNYDGNLEYLVDDYDNKFQNARSFAWCSGELESENLKYYCF